MGAEAYVFHLARVYIAQKLLHDNGRIPSHMERAFRRRDRYPSRKNGAELPIQSRSNRGPLPGIAHRRSSSPPQVHTKLRQTEGIELCL